MSNHWLNKKAEEEKKEFPTWDFETALMDTIKEKYESQYARIIGVYNVCNRGPKKNWIMPGRKR